VGPSGCGKTTLLSLLSGYEQPSGGEVVRHGSVRTVFQRDGLFPWMTCAENIRLGLRDARNEAHRHEQLDELLSLIRLNGFANRYPHQLSGGMRQLVEVARAMAGNTDILLMDEPFSALDYMTRLRMRGDLTRLLTEKPRTVVFVTHDIEEACQLADRVLVLSPRPARVALELSIDVPRPRSIIDPKVALCMQQVFEAMGLGQDGACVDPHKAVPGALASEIAI
jgi:ABC-type nitrate/sulfonate/bicarbonate transport system ATPase subunit